MEWKEYIVRLSEDGKFVWRYVTTARNETEAGLRAKVVVSSVARIEAERLSIIEVIEK